VNSRVRKSNKEKQEKLAEHSELLKLKVKNEQKIIS